VFASHWRCNTTKKNKEMTKLYSIIKELEEVTDQLSDELTQALMLSQHTDNDKQKIKMLERAKEEAMRCLTTMRYINQ
jgi:type II secretory pathway component PulJ